MTGNGAASNDDLRGRVAALIAGIDELLARQLDAILHHSDFKQLESAWRGLQLLVDGAPRGRRCRICVLDVSWPEIIRDMERALEVDQSAMFWKLYTTEFDMPGGEPFGVVLCNFDISHKRAADIRTLRRLANIAEAAFCTLLFPASPALFGMDRFADFHPSIDPRKLFGDAEYRMWQQMRADTSSRFLGFLLPHVLLRKPWGMTGPRRGGFPYRETCRDTSELLWGNSGFALIRILLREFEDVGWFAHIRGAPRDTLAGGILADVLPVIPVDSCDDLVSVLPATDLVISDEQERNLADCGFIPLVHCWQTAYCAFFSLPSLYRPRKTDNEVRDKNDRIASQIQNILCASRFAHYIKVMMRDKIGSFLNADQCQTFMEDWLSDYCIAGDNLPWSTQARFPLKAAQLQVREKPAEPGHYLCDIHLVPHYQYDGMVGEIQLTTELAQPRP